MFLFRNDQQKTDYAVILSDTSQYTERYNQFELTEGVDLTFDLVGDYRYFVYEQASDSNLDPDNATLIERGMMKLLPASDTVINAYDPDNSDNKVYVES